MIGDFEIKICGLGNVVFVGVSGILVVIGLLIFLGEYVFSEDGLVGYDVFWLCIGIVFDLVMEMVMFGFGDVVVCIVFNIVIVFLFSLVKEVEGGEVGLVFWILCVDGLFDFEGCGVVDEIDVIVGVYIFFEILLVEVVIDYGVGDWVCEGLGFLGVGGVC